MGSPRLRSNRIAAGTIGTTIEPMRKPRPRSGSPGVSRPSEARESALGGLLDEAQAAVSTSANSLRDIRERYRTEFNADVERWEKLRKRLARNGNGAPRTWCAVVAQQISQMRRWLSDGVTLSGSVAIATCHDHT